jgi:hypothetical protein
LSNSGHGITFKGVARPSNCLPFDAARAARVRPGKGTQRASGLQSRAERLTGIFDHLSPAQAAFLSGVLAILAAHGEEALTRSCEMVLERFGRGQTG